MPLLVGPAAVVAAALVVSGTFKLVDPEPTSAMLRAFRLPSSQAASRGVGLVEVVLGTLALAAGTWAMAFVAVTYLVFTAMMTRLVLLGDDAPSCGCFGRLSAEPTWVHVGADAAGAVIAAAAAVAWTPGLAESLGGPVGETLLVLGFVALGTWLFVTVMTVLADTLAAASRTAPAKKEVAMFHLVGTDDRRKARR